MTDWKNCPSNDQLERLLADRLTDGEEQFLNSHLQSCAVCVGRLDQLSSAPDLSSLSADKPAPPGDRPDDTQVLTRIKLALLPRGRAHTSPETIEMLNPPGYQILSKIGQGGMGVVFKAKHEALQRLVALKTLPMSQPISASSRARFQVEARAVARLQHPNIVQVYEVGEFAGSPFLALEYVHGATLAEHIAGGRFAPRRAAAMLRTVARAIHYAHSNHIVHRDLKPSNILIGEGDIPKITDFGLACALENESGTEALTRTGTFVGTPRYMAPEQVRTQGARSVAVTAATDVFALGVILYEMLTGRVPFDAASPVDTMLLVLHEDPLPLRRLNTLAPRDLEVICLKCLEKDPRRRYTTAAELADDLERFLGGMPIHARPASMPERAVRWCLRNPATAGLLATTALTLLLATAFSSLFALRAHSSARTARESKGVAQAEAEAANQARLQAQRARGEADHAREVAQQDLYYSEMRLAHEEARAGGGMRQLRTLLDRWRPTNSQKDRRQWEWYYLDSLTRQAMQTWIFPGHASDPTAISLDGRFLARGDQAGVVRIWDTETGTLQSKITGDERAISTLAWSPDSSRLAIGDEHGMIELRQRDGSGELIRFPAHGTTVATLSWSSDGQYVASSSPRGRLFFWKTSDGSLEKFFTGIDVIRGISWHPSGRQFALARDMSFAIYDVESSSTFDLPIRVDAWAVAWSPNGEQVATADFFGNVSIWSVETKTQLATHSISGTPLNSLVWSRDGSMLACAGRRGAIRILDGSTLEDRSILRGHADEITSLAWRDSDGMLVSIGKDRSARVWNSAITPSPTTIPSVSSIPQHVRWSPDDQYIAASCYVRTSTIWHVESATVAANWTRHGEVAWHPNGDLWTGISGETVGTWSPRRGDSYVPITARDDLVMIRWSPTGQAVAGCGMPGQSIGIWDAELTTQLAKLEGHENRIRCFEWNAAGNRLASASDDGTVRIWDVAHARPVHVLQAHAGRAFAVAWHPDGTRLASGGEDGVARIWDCETGRELKTLTGHTELITTIDWNPDGRRIATGSRDWTVRIWDPETTGVAAVLRDHARWVICVRWSHDGLKLASAGDDNSIKIWDATPGYRSLRSPQLLAE